MIASTFPINWPVGWSLLLLGFISGAVLGRHFHRPDFLGGYDTWRRRLVRLGHIALCALGMLNLIFALAPWPVSPSWLNLLASYAFVLGGVSMPLVCFLSAWKRNLRRLFVVPVTALFLAVITMFWSAL